MSAPERIWAGNRLGQAYWTGIQTAASFVEYVRADLYDKLDNQCGHWISENRRNLKAGQDAAYKLADLNRQLAETRAALEKIADCVDRNLGRQVEKLRDIPSIARAALESPNDQ